MVVILAAAGLIFRLAEKPLTASLITPEVFRQRRNMWFAITLIAFLSHNFWLYTLICGVLLVAYGQGDRQPLALYCMLLFVIPPFDVQVPGLGLMNYFFDLNHVRLLNLVVLLPAALRLSGEKQNGASDSRLVDAMIVVYILLQFLLQAAVVNFTGMLRGLFYLLVDVWLVYYVASRSLRDMAGFRNTVASLVLAISVMAPMAVFEVARSWLIYDSLAPAMGAPAPEMGVYIMRGEGGLLRANVAAGNSIVLGYFMMIGLALMVFLGPLLPSRNARIGACVALGAGIVAALSRGPWVGAVVALVIGLFLGQRDSRRIFRWMGGAGLIFGLLLMSPMGDAVIDHLPFVGTVDEGSVTYRQQLFDVSMLVLWQNPMFGAFDYMLDPQMEQMRQGQGIIDIVNTYLAIALPYGLVGLTLFVLPFIYMLVVCFLTRRRVAKFDLQAESLGRALLGALVGILVTIATVSSICAVPTLYWMMLGMCVAYARVYAHAEMPAVGARRQTRSQAEIKDCGRVSF
jgi:hypothetical protein